MDLGFLSTITWVQAAVGVLLLFFGWLFGASLYNFRGYNIAIKPLMDKIVDSGAASPSLGKKMLTLDLVSAVLTSAFIAATCVFVVMAVGKIEIIPLVVGINMALFVVKPYKSAFYQKYKTAEMFMTQYGKKLNAEALKKKYPKYEDLLKDVFGDETKAKVVHHKKKRK